MSSGQVKRERREAKRRAAAQLASDLAVPLREDEEIGPDTSNAKYHNISEGAKAEALIHCVKSRLGFQSEGGRSLPTRALDAESVREIADLLTNLWPRKSDTAFTIPSSGFSVLHWSDLLPNTLTRAITRTSLYADTILVANPFVHRVLFHPQHSPLVVPEKWIHEWHLAASSLIALEPWINAGIVKLFSVRAMFDFKSARALDLLARKRLAENRRYFKQVVPENNEMLIRTILSVPPGMRRKTAEGDWFKLTAPQVDSLLKAAEEAGKNPIIELMPAPTGSSITGGGPGIGLPQVEKICAEYGISVLTSSPMYTKMIERRAEKITGPLQNVTAAFSRLPLQFLNDVPVDYAVGLRRDGALHRFRNYLSDLARVAAPGVDARSAQGFSDRLNSEYDEYKRELRSVQASLAMRSIGTWSIAALAMNSAWVSGTLGIAGMIGIGGTTAAAMAGGLTKAFLDRRKLQASPLGVLLKLDRSTS